MGARSGEKEELVIKAATLLDASRAPIAHQCPHGFLLYYAPWYEVKLILCLYNAFNNLKKQGYMERGEEMETMILC